MRIGTMRRRLAGILMIAGIAATSWSTDAKAATTRVDLSGLGMITDLNIDGTADYLDQGLYQIGNYTRSEKTQPAPHTSRTGFAMPLAAAR